MIISKHRQIDMEISGIVETQVLDVKRVIIAGLLNHNSKPILDHFSQQELAAVTVGQRNKKERIERIKNRPPKEVSLRQALKMHDGNVLIKGMFVGGSPKIEKMFQMWGL